MCTTVFIAMFHFALTLNRIFISKYDLRHTGGFKSDITAKNVDFPYESYIVYRRLDAKCSYLKSRFPSFDGAMFPSMNKLSIITCICIKKKISSVIKNQTTGYLYYIRSVSKQFISNVCITTHKEIITIADNVNIKTIFHRECTSHFDFFYKQLWSRYILQISSQKDYDKLFPQSVMTFMHG